MITITCTKCSETKPIDEFHRGKLGKHGRMSWCKKCDSARRKIYDTKNAAKVKAGQERWARANREKVCERVRRYRRRHPARISAVDKSYRERHRQKRVFWQMTREARKKRAIPAWANLDAIKEIYLNCPEGHYVDHVIPLMAMRGREHIASGLHCEANLQYLTAEENRRKWARLPEELT